MLYDVHNGQTSVVLRVKLRDSSVSTGAGLTGLTFSSTGLRISTIADNEATATAYTVAGTTIETVTTLGTYAAPTATKCRFKEVDATNHPGLYEIQIADARFAVSNAKSLTISLSGATNLAQCDVVIPLRVVDPYSAAFGLILAKTTNITGFNDIAATAIVSSGAINTLAGAVTAVTTTATATNLTNLPSIPANWLTAAGINAAALNGKGDWLTAAGTLARVTLVDTVTTYTGNTPQTGDAYARLGSPAGGSVSADISAIKSETDTILTDVNTGGGAIYSRLGSPVGGSLSADIAAVKASVGTPAQAGAVALGSTGLDSVVIEAGLNARQALSIIAAACAGTSSGVNAGSPVYKGAGVATTRITATASNGDRSGVTLTPPA